MITWLYPIHAADGPMPDIGDDDDKGSGGDEKDSKRRVLVEQSI
ncbi:MAG TPA: hypothetical protein VKU38_10670 [Ktedonobacteraceae bacterium]|nr:hypothetical protein [Ktedonobacteraceae bacterium]